MPSAPQTGLDIDVHEHVGALPAPLPAPPPPPSSPTLPPVLGSADGSGLAGAAVDGEDGEDGEDGDAVFMSAQHRMLTLLKSPSWEPHIDGILFSCFEVIGATMCPPSQLVPVHTYLRLPELQPELVKTSL